MSLMRKKLHLRIQTTSEEEHYPIRDHSYLTYECEDNQKDKKLPEIDMQLTKSEAQVTMRQTRIKDSFIEKNCSSKNSFMDSSKFEQFVKPSVEQRLKPIIIMKQCIQSLNISSSGSDKPNNRNRQLSFLGSPKILLKPVQRRPIEQIKEDKTVKKRNQSIDKQSIHPRNIDTSEIAKTHKISHSKVNNFRQLKREIEEMKEMIIKIKISQIVDETHKNKNKKNQKYKNLETQRSRRAASKGFKTERKPNCEGVYTSIIKRSMINNVPNVKYSSMSYHYPKYMRMNEMRYPTSKQCNKWLSPDLICLDRRDSRFS